MILLAVNTVQHTGVSRENKSKNEIGGWLFFLMTNDEDAVHISFRNNEFVYLAKNIYAMKWLKEIGYARIRMHSFRLLFTIFDYLWYTKCAKIRNFVHPLAICITHIRLMYYT